MKKRNGTTGIYVLLLIGSLFICFPLYICLITTFKTPEEIAISYFTLPKSLYLGNYFEVLTDPKLLYAYGNTFYITILSLLGSFLIMPAMSFAISRGMAQTKSFRCAYIFLLLGIFIPFQVRMVPLVKLLSSIHMLDQTGLIILYIAHATCESVFLYVGFLSSISTSLEEAAYIDGATTFQLYRKIIAPLMKPIIATVLIREGLSIWNDFMLPLITLNRSWKLWTLTLYQYIFQSEYGVDYNLAFTSFAVASLPIILFYLLMQKQIIGGLTNGAVKG